MAILEEIKAEIEANKDRIYRFWFSAKQKEFSRRCKESEGKQYRPNRVTIDGKTHEYTECMSGEFLTKKSNFDDAVYLGETSWRNIS